MDILKEAKKFADTTKKKAYEVANDINESLEKRRETRNLLEKMADCEDEVIMYLLSLKDDEVNMLPDKIKRNVLVIKKIEDEITAMQTNDFPEEDEFEESNFSSDVQFCTKCGKKIGTTDIYCKYCGALR